MKKIITILTAFLMISTSVQAFTVENIDLSDIEKPSSWAESEIEKANEYDILTDDVLDFYREYINRGEFAGLIVRCLEKLTSEIDLDSMELSDNNFFNDTNDEDIIKASAIGVVKGVGDGNFDPDSNITRQEIAVMMYRAIKYVETKTGKTFLNNNNDISSFADSSSVDEWAKEAVGSLCNNGIMKGTSETALSPLSNTTKEQAILLDLRIYELMK